jgi:mannose-6-phosphate isomerase
MSMQPVKPSPHQKPWGMTNLSPWSAAGGAGAKIGELWFDVDPSETSRLQLKLLFATEPLSIQVHPTNDFAKTIGLPSGKTEAWYVVDAHPDARIGVGLTQNMTRQQFRHALRDGSIADLLLWRRVMAGDSYLIPAGTVHALGGGLVVAEIQQRVDVTFRIFDHGRGRELHLEQAIAVADAAPASGAFEQFRLSNTRRLLAVCAEFTFERIDLPPSSSWRIDAPCETWVLALSGTACIGGRAIGSGEAFFARQETAALRTGEAGLGALVAYADCMPNARLLRRMDAGGRELPEDPREVDIRARFASAVADYARSSRGIGG